MELDDIRKKNIGRRIYKLRREGKKWEEVSEIISTEFEDNFTTAQIRNLYDYYISLNEVILNARGNARREAFNVNDYWGKEMKQMMEAIKFKAMKHLDIADKMLVESYDKGDKKEYFKNLPAAISLFRSVLDQLNFLNKRLEKIEINQNNLILNEPQILNIVNKAWKEKEREADYILHPGKGVLVPNAKKKKKKKNIA